VWTIYIVVGEPVRNVMATIWNLIDPLLKPFARLWWAYTKVDWDKIPRPSDSPVVTIPGPDAARILLVGNGPAMGYGVTSHTLALPGQLARLVSEATGRGVRARVIADETLTVHNVEERFAANAEPCDLVVVMLGGPDTARLTSARAWRRGLNGLVHGIELTAPDDVRVLLVAIPPISSMPLIRGLAGLAAIRHAELLNRVAESVASRHRDVDFVPFVPPLERDPDRYRSARTYREWAQLILPAAVRALASPSGSFETRKRGGRPARGDDR